MMQRERASLIIPKISVDMHMATLPLRCLTNFWSLVTRGGVEDTRLEAKAKDTKKIRGQEQGQPFRGQTLSRPRTGMLEA